MGPSEDENKKTLKEIENLMIDRLEAERRAAVVETKLWGSVIEVIDMLREELKRRNQVNQEISRIHKEIEEIKSILIKSISKEKEPNSA